MMNSRHVTPAPVHHASSMRGVVLLALLLTLALGAIAAMAAADVWAVTRQRDRETQLLYVGDQYRLAIRRYYFATSPRVFPASFDELLEDKRFPIPVRHLRKLYPDPITGSAEWGAVRVADRITGIYSLSEQQPIKQANFEPVNAQFVGKTSYRDWQFIVVLPSRAAPRKSAALDPQSAPSELSDQPVARKPS